MVTATIAFGAKGPMAGLSSPWCDFLRTAAWTTASGTDGTMATDFGDGGVAFALVLQPDGKSVAAGATGRGAFAAGKFALARYLPNGSPDRSFGMDGKVISDFGWRGALALGLRPDGKLVAAGAEEIGDRRAFALARYLPDGSMDPAFGAGGKVITDFDGATPR